MAKSLLDAPPSSAVARLLNRDTARRATQTIARDVRQPTEPDYESAALPEREKAITNKITREFILTEESEATFCDLLEVFRRATRSRLTASQLFRAMLRTMRCALPVLQYEATRLGPMRLPGNGREARQLRDDFENRLAMAIASALHAVGQVQQPVTAAEQPARRLLT